MSISKTQVVGWIMTGLGVLANLFGIDFPLAAIETAIGMISDNILATIAMIVGPIIITLRTVTENPVVSGLRGLIFKQDTPEDEPTETQVK